jgi:endonuclease-8
MPEGDTIHYAANRIRPVLLGGVPRAIRTPQPRHRADRWPERLAGRRVTSVDARGKHLFLRFEGGLALHSHLRMTGAWRVYSRREPWRRSPTRAWLVIETDGHQVVQFDGPVLELMTDLRTHSDPRLSALGPDVLGPVLDERRFLAALRHDDPTRPLGDALLDQRTIAGIGNLWKAEACFAAGLDPRRATGDVSDEQALAVVRAARLAMQRSARDGFQARPRAVYRRAGRPCSRCGQKIRQRGQGEDNRMAYWCPGCQH